jgi:hypothetical protein
VSATWTIILSVLAPIGVLFISVMFKVFAHQVSEEVEGRLDQIGYAVLRLACKRLPVELRENYYQEWAAELDAHFLTATERPLTRLYWSLRFPVPLLFRAESFARIQDPAVFENLSDPVEQFVRASRPFRLFVFAGLSPGITAALLWVAFRDPATPLGGAIVYVILATLMVAISVLALLIELANVIAVRRGSMPSWAPPVGAAAEWILWLHRKIGDAPRWGRAHLYRLAGVKVRQDKVGS